jgi:hypothetical protein
MEITIYPQQFESWFKLDCHGRGQAIPLTTRLDMSAVHPAYKEMLVDEE